MRVNEPTTNREIAVPEDHPLVSKTDLDGRIVAANRAFVEVTGHPITELIGASQNLVRHPDMPPQVFADLWATIKAGRAWEGIVRNLTKAGDFYWVRANVTPLGEDGKVSGYISICVPATRAQIAEAEAAYRMIRSGQGGKIGLRDGMLIRRGLRHTLRAALSSVAGRLAVTGAVCVATIGVVGWLGLQGMDRSNQALQRVYQGSGVETARITDTRAAMRSNVQLVTLMALELRGDNPAAAVDKIQAIRASNDRVEGLLRDYMRTELSPVQAELAGLLVQERTAFSRDGLLPAIELAERGDGAGLDRHLHARVMPLFAVAAATNNKLVDLQMKQGETAFIEAERAFKFRFWAAVGTMLAGGVILIGLGIALLRAIARPLRQLGDSFDAIGRNDLKRAIATVGAGEFWPIVGHLRGLQAKLAYAMSERIEMDRGASLERRAAIQAMAEHVEREAGDAMEEVATGTAEMARQADSVAELTGRVSLNARSVTEAAGQALANAQAVGAASEELSASIQGIAARIGHATKVAQRAVANGQNARQRIQSLSDGAVRIGDVVQLIRGIAGQTNLLALNATIEAARAGEAGRGFNVVANEVKGLAGQTARSTEDIARQVSAIQEATGGAVAAVAELGQSIEEIAEVFTHIASAIEQQAAATLDIARNVTESSVAAQAVTERIGEVSRDAEVSRRQADGIRNGSAAVAVSIAELRGSLVRTIRTATTDADRRMKQRASVDEKCTVIWRGRNVPGRLVDASVTGGRLMTSEPISVGEAGTLVLGHSPGDATVGFEVRSVHSDGGMGVSYDPGTMSPGFAAAVRRLVGKAEDRAA